MPIQTAKNLSFPLTRTAATVEDCGSKSPPSRSRRSLRFLSGLGGKVLFLICLLLALAPGSVGATSQAQSAITVHVYKAGLFSGLGHNHTIRAPVAKAALDEKGRSVEIVVLARDMRVIDAEVPDSDRAEIQKTMLGPKVLDAEKHPEIRFKSSRIEAQGSQHYIVTGTLELHGASKTISFEVTGGSGRYRGRIKISQTDFGIKPVAVAGGTIKVKNELEIEFDVNAQEFAASRRR